MKKIICSGLLLFFAFGLWADSCPMCKTLPIHMIMAAKRHRDKAKQEEEKGNQEGADAHNKCATLKEKIASAMNNNDDKELDKSATEYKQAHERKRLFFREKTVPAADEKKPCTKCTNGLE